jgi:hypothetical protein
MATDLGNCDYCGAPIGFYGCPKHGTDCYDIADELFEGAVFAAEAAEPEVP